MEFGTDVHVPQRMKLTDFASKKPRWELGVCSFYVKCLDKHWMDVHQIWFRHSCPPEDESFASVHDQIHAQLMAAGHDKHDMPLVQRQWKCSRLCISLIKLFRVVRSVLRPGVSICPEQTRRCRL